MPIIEKVLLINTHATIYKADSAQLSVKPVKLFVVFSLLSVNTLSILFGRLNYVHVLFVELVFSVFLRLISLNVIFLCLLQAINKLIIDI